MKILVTEKLPINVEEKLKEYNIDVLIPKRHQDKNKMINIVKNMDGIICLLKDSIEKEVIDAGNKLKIIANYAVGFDNIDIKYAKEKNIFVTNTPDVLTEATADLVFGLLLASARRIPEANDYVRKDRFKGWRPDEMLGYDVYGETLGIFGFGRIGQAVARRAKGFNMRILYTARSEKSMPFKCEYVDYNTLIKESDYISVNAPLNKETKGIFNYNTFKQMKENAIFINTARGKIVKEKDLVKALKENLIAGAALDVYENEPLIEEELKTMDNCILAPHMGSATKDTRTEMANICVNAIIDVLINKKGPKTCVNC